MNYVETITGFINKALRDEISASILYHKLGYSLIGIAGTEIAEELTAHGDEEFGHFKEILEFAYNHNIAVMVTTDMDVIGKDIKSADEATAFVQTLEQTAIADYKTICDIAKANSDVETYEFFAEKLQDEMRHFDDIAKYTGQKRDLQYTSISAVLGLSKN